MTLLLSALLTVLVVALAVLLHYQALLRLNRWLSNTRLHYRPRIVIALAGALLAHTAEIAVFAVAYYLMVARFGWGKLVGAVQEGQLLDYFYYSFTTYTTLGFGDIHPYGEIRFLTGIESLTGLVLITWTASFLYLEMQNSWQRG